ncbi:cytokinin riboside 5'-monophosphate phosphoribohydrolase [Leptospira kobayashii]|uniref:AMP nucleosidase n=1 Tax=Leptospira kobayashii TaxID=1917830 RepID=A0ABM7UHD1_9LEPT|nr:LOG family protein [Leptospira kobayashii]BDA78075.1 cytokinin riboside 5'-monophosphate phosphoribohydrolase [Leptospira kobayashii]
MTTLAFENKDFLWGDDAGSLRILSEYLHPKAEFIRNGVTDTVVVFGSARIPSPEGKKNANGALHKGLLPFVKYYEQAVEFSRLLSDWGNHFDREFPGRKLFISTGGGPGIMEAGNRGASEAGAESIALNIALPFEQHANPYASPKLSFEYHYFFMRKLWFMKHCRGIVAFPGGFGTFDELFEVLTLVQTQKKEKIPILLYGKEFWDKVVNFPVLAEYGLINEEDLNLLSYANTPEEAFLFFQEKIRLELTQKLGTKS